jgi:hypothetical protein
MFIAPLASAPPLTALILIGHHITALTTPWPVACCSLIPGGAGGCLNSRSGAYEEGFNSFRCGVPVSDDGQRSIAGAGTPSSAN